MDISNGIKIFIFVMIALFLAFLPFGIIVIYMKFTKSSTIYKCLFALFGFALLLAIYIFIGGMFYKFAIEPFYSFIPRRKMVIWDNIGYTLIFILLLLTIAAVVKSIRDRRVKWDYARTLFGMVLLILIFYLIYYIYLFDDKLPLITLVLTFVIIGMTILMIILEYTVLANSVFLIPLYMIYGAGCITFVICLFWLIIRTIENLYNNLNKK